MLGPVFRYEAGALALRRGHYWLRAGLAATLLLGLGLSWLAGGPGTGTVPHDQLQAFATRAFGHLATAQVALVLAIAPAALAGSFVVDKARGTLADLLTTDLSGAEIALGKLGAQLLPLLALVAAGAPVMALVALYGGIDPVTFASGYAVTIGAALTAGAVSFGASLVARRPTDALMASYLTIGAWLLLAFAPDVFGWGAWRSVFELTNPFALTIREDWSPGNERWIAALAHLGAGVGLLALVAVVSVVALRPLALATSKPKSRRSWAGTWRRKALSPLLEANPVLWREATRAPSWLWRGHLLAFFAVGGAFAWSTGSDFAAIERGARTFAFLNGFQVAVGLALVAALAGAAFAEERTQGGLDVLLVTPLTPEAIVWGKAAGGLAAVVELSVPCLTWTSWMAFRLGGLSAIPATAIYLTSVGAFTVAAGLFFSSRTERVGRAVAASVVLSVAMSAGWIMGLVVLSALPGIGHWFRPGNQAMIIAAMISPFYGTVAETMMATRLEGGHWPASTAQIWVGTFVSALAFGAATTAFLWRALGWARGAAEGGTTRPGPRKGRP